MTLARGGTSEGLMAGSLPGRIAQRDVCKEGRLLRVDREAAEGQARGLAHREVCAHQAEGSATQAEQVTRAC